MLPKVFVVILNFNRADETIECVESVKRSDYDNYGILLVDNGSTDGSLQVLRQRFPDLEMIQNGENLGYAEGNNRGIHHALNRGCDYVLILNNDTVVAETALRLLVEEGEKHQEATLLAPQVRFYDRPNLIDSCGTEMDWFRLKPRLGHYGKEDQGRFQRIEEKEIIPGSALLLKKKIFGEVGFFDERFFLIHEDADLCLRNLRKNFKNIVVPKALVYHKVSRTLSAYPFLASYYSIRNMLYLCERHGTFLERVKARIGLLTLILKNLFKLLSCPGEREKVKGFYQGVKDYYLRRMGRFEEERNGRVA